MAEDTIHADGQTIRFRTDLIREWVRKNRFSPYTGRGVNNVINQKFDTFHTIRHPLLTRLQGAGVSGSTMLRGNGEAIGDYYWDTVPTYYRNAVEFNKEDKEKSNLALMKESRSLLLEWAMNETRDRQINAMGALYDGTTYTNLAVTSGAFETIADAWLVTNKARTAFGAYAQGGSSGGSDHSADLAQLDTSADTFVYQRLDEMRRLAEDADPHIRPFKTDQQGETYVAFCGSGTFEDLKASLVTVNTSADFRGMKLTANGNILARDGDMFWNGTIIRKVPEITTLFSKAATAKQGQGALYNTGNSGTTNVELVVLCGTQALMHGFGQAPHLVVDRDFDFGFRPAVAVELKEDIKKTFFNDIQHGIVTGYYAVG